MRLLVVIASLVLTGVGHGAFADDDSRSNRFQSFVSVLGPVSLSPEQNLEVCTTDISVITQIGTGDEDRRLSKHRHNQRIKQDRVVWSSTRIEVFDSLDTSRPLPLGIDDIVFSSGKGSCTDIPGYDIARDGSPRSVVILLTTLTEARAMFNPLASGQLSAPGNTSAGLLLPAVQGVREAPPRNCCACVPVCGCGICD